MGLLSWLTGSANKSARRRGGGQQKNKKKRAERTYREEPRRSRPSKSEPRASKPREQKSTYDPNKYRAGAKPQTNKPQTKSFQPQAYKSTNVADRYKQFKSSSFAPKTTAPKKPNKPTALENAQKAFKAGQSARAGQTKKSIVGTQANKPKSNVISDFSKPKNYNYKKDLQKAAKTGQSMTYLGTKQKTVEVNVESKKKQKAMAKQQTKAAQKSYYKSDDWTTTKTEMKRQNRKMWYKALKDAGYSDAEAKAWMNSDEGKKNRRETYLATKNDVKKSINKDIGKSVRKDIKDSYNFDSVNALTRGEFDKMVTGSRLGKNLGNKYLKSVGGKELQEKIGSKTVEAGLRSKAAYGVMQGMSKGDIWSGSVGKYNKGAKSGIEKVKGSGGYNVGYGVGMAADMLMGGVATRGASVAEGTGKLASKLAGKGVPKEAAKELAKETGKITRSEGFKRFAKNRAGELVAETPTNVLDAAKMSLDADGKINKKEFRKWLFINSALTGGVGGAMEGLGAAATRKLGNETIELIAKREAGNITEDELEKLTKNIKKLSNKSKADIRNISSEIADARMAKINADDAARKAEKYGELVKDSANKGRKQGVKKGKYTYEASQSRYQYAKKLNENEQRMGKLADKRKAQAHAKGVDSVVEAARENRVADLGETMNKLVNKENELMEKVKADNTMQGHAKAAAELEEVRKAIKVTREQLDRARSDTYSGRVAKNLREQRKNNTMGGHEKALREGEALQAEGKARADKAFADAKEAFEKNPTPETKARMDIAEEAVQRAKAEAPKANTPKAETPKAQKPKRAKGEKKPKTREEHINDTIKNHKKNVAEIDNELNKVASDLRDLEEKGRYLGGERKRSKDPGRIAELEKELKSVDAQKTALNDELYRLRQQKTKINTKITNAEDRLIKIKNAKKTEEPKAKNAEEPNPKYASTDEDIPYTNKSPEADNVRNVIKDSADGLDGTPVKPKIEGVDRISSDGTVDATTKQPRGVVNKIYNDVVRTALFDSLNPLEYIAHRLPEAQRKAMLAQINELRRAVKTGRATVATKGRDIYKRYGLNIRKNKAKMADFERYCFLKHDLARVKEGSGFTHLDEAGIRKEISELEKKYSGEEFNVVDKETGEILGSELQMYQKDMVKYFRDLLDMEVEAGITSAHVAESFKKRFPDFVPSYREKEFSEILKNHTFEEIDVGRGMKTAKGGGDGLVPLYNQMQTKTNIVTKRVELNRTLNMLCMASGTSEKELDKLVPFFKDMRAEEKAVALMDAQIFTGTRDGKYTAYMYREGSKIEMNIDKNVYDAIRRWSGEDRKVHVLTQILNNRVLGGANAQFKKWITDYSLIFGVKNFARDQATALFYTKDKVGYVKNMMKGMGVCMLPDKALPKGWNIYKEAYQTYKENGGVISQFIARDSASDKLFDPIGRYNPLKWVENFNSAMETVPRMTEFISALDSKAMKAAGKDGDYAAEFRKLLGNREAVTDAMYRAKDVTLNFDRSGWFGAILNRGPVPFFNPAAQGFDKLGRTLIRDNIKYGESGAIAWTKSGKQGIRSFFDETTMGSFIKMGTYLSGMVVLPEAVWNHWFGDEINGKAKGYEKQSDYNRDTHYLLPIGDGKFFKIPKARELASLQMVMDFVYDNMEYGSGSTWEKLFGDERVRDLKSMAKLSFEQSGPINPVTDSIVAPIWRVTQNKTWYGGKIESGADDERHREDGELYKIWDENTSAMAKSIGKQFNISPKKVDNVLDSYLGVIYDMGISQTSAKNNVKTTREKEGLGRAVVQLTRNPWGNAFIIDSVFQNANKSDYYDLVDRQKKKLEGMKEGSDEYVELKAHMTKEKNAFSYTSSQYDELQSQIWLDDKMTVAEKRKYCRLLKKGDNLLYNERKDGKKVPSKDPMAVAWNMKDANGKRVLSTDKIIDSCSFTFKDGDNTIKDAWKRHKDSGGTARKFMEVTLAARDCKRYAGDSMSNLRWEEVAYTSQLAHIKGRDKAVAAYIEDDENLKTYTGNAKVYEEYGGSKKTYYTMKRAVAQGAFDLGYDYPSQMRDGELTMTLANQRTKGGKKYRDLAYQANGRWILDNRMNAGRCLDTRLKGKYTSTKLKKFCDKYELNPSEGHKWTDKDIEKVCKAIEKEYKGEDRELWAAKFVVITGLTWKNPYGDIGDYSLDYDTGVYCVDSKGYGGHGRRRRRHRRHGGGGGGGKAFTPEAAKLSDIKPSSGGGTGGGGTGSGSTRSSARIKVKDYTVKSNLDDAYRKKVKKLREENRRNK